MVVRPRMRSLSPTIIENGNSTLEELERLRLKGTTDETVRIQLDREFDRRRRNIEKCISEDRKWYNISYRGMELLVEKTKILPLNKLTRFLDLGCCPGGYSDYFLKENLRVRGVGISLEVLRGGFPLRISGTAFARYNMHWGDISFYDICLPPSRPYPGTGRPLSHVPFTASGFQLVILDAHCRPVHGSESRSTRENDRLLISQLIIGLQCLDLGGSLIVTLKQVACVRTAQVLYMLDQLAQNIVTFKNPEYQKTSGVFQAVATGVGLGIHAANLPAYLENLRHVWWELTYGGDEGRGRDFLESDLDFIADYEKLEKAYLERLIELGEIPWSVQKDALTEISNKQERLSWRRGSTDNLKKCAISQAM